MNLHEIVRGAITSVNDDIAAVYKQCTGYTTGANGKQVATYAADANVQIQVQAASGKDIERLNNLGIQGVFRKVYDYGNKQGIVRLDSKGGDLLVFPQVPGGTDATWKVTQVAETWADWSSVVVVLQA